MSEKGKDNIVLLQVPEFKQGGVPVEVAAEVFGKSAAWVRDRIVDGKLPIGTYSSESDMRKNFYISPRLLWEYTGFVYQ